MQAQNSPEIFRRITPEPSPTRTEKTGQTYYSASCQKFRSKISAYITTQKYISD